MIGDVAEDLDAPNKRSTEPETVLSHSVIAEEYDPPQMMAR